MCVCSILNRLVLTIYQSFQILLHMSISVNFWLVNITLCEKQTNKKKPLRVHQHWNNKYEFLINFRTFVRFPLFFFMLGLVNVCCSPKSLFKKHGSNNYRTAGTCGLTCRQTWGCAVHRCLCQASHSLPFLVLVYITDKKLISEHSLHVTIHQR